MVRWGIIGAGNIAHRFVGALQQCPGASLQAVACRTKQKAEAFAKEFPCPSNYGSFQEIIDDCNVDAIYVAVPHKFHHEWVCRALRAKKAVLCEKPSMMNSAQMAQVKELAMQNNTFFMEAMKTRCVPLYRHLVSMIEEGVIGDIKEVYATFCNISPYVPNAYHYEPGQGGCLLDLGIYNTNYLVDFLQGEYQVKNIEARHYENGIEVYIHATMEYENGTIGILESSFDCKKENYVLLTGTKGTIKVPQLHRPVSLELTVDGQTTIIEKPYEIDDFYSQIAHVEECLRNNLKQSPIISFDDSLACIQLVDRIKDAIK